MRSRVVTYRCGCGESVAVRIYPIIPATWTGPQEGGDYEPTECPRCNESITGADLWEQDPERDR
jgi:hypothetical protein